LTNQRGEIVLDGRHVYRIRCRADTTADGES
jgi:hypothetical protein